MTEVTLIVIILVLMVCLAITVIWTFWRLLQQDGLPTIEKTRNILIGMGMGLLLGILGGLSLGWIVLDNVMLGISLGAGGGLSLGLGIVNTPLIYREGSK